MKAFRSHAEIRSDGSLHIYGSQDIGHPPTRFQGFIDTMNFRHRVGAPYNSLPTYSGPRTGWTLGSITVCNTWRNEMHVRSATPWKALL